MSDDSGGRRGDGTRSGKVVVASIVAVAVATVGYFAAGMPGMDHGGSGSMAGMDMSSNASTPATVREATPAEFANLVDASGSLLVNVHIPYDGEIDGTDLFIPYNALATDALPADRSTRLLVYCRTGNMSSSAVEALHAMGYTDIVELSGGLDAWRESGYSVSTDPARN